MKLTIKEEQKKKQKKLTRSRKESSRSLMKKKKDKNTQTYPPSWPAEFLKNEKEVSGEK